MQNKLFHRKIIKSGNTFHSLGLEVNTLGSCFDNLIRLFVCLIGVSTRLNSYNTQATLARSGVYGVVVSGKVTVMEYLVSSSEVARVEPAQPEPMIIISFLGVVILLR